MTFKGNFYPFGVVNVEYNNKRPRFEV